MTGLLFGLAPAWHAAKTDLNEVLKQATRASSGARPRLRNGLAAAELALATMLLIGAGLLTQSLAAAAARQPRLPARRLLTFQIALPRTKYPARQGRGVLPQRCWSRCARCRACAPPPCRAASRSAPADYTTTPIATTGPSPLPPDTAVPTDWRVVSPGFFQAMNIPLLRGREFTDADAPARRRWSSSSARRRRGGSGATPIRSAARSIVRAISRGSTPSSASSATCGRATLSQESPAIYYPSIGLDRRDGRRRADRGAADVDAAGGPRRRCTSSIRRCRSSTVRTMDEWVSNSAAQPRLNAILLAVFAAVALLIAAIGIYGVLAYSVTQRTREIGLRMALGAPRGQVLRLIVREGMTVGAIGIGVGLAGALALSRVLASLVFDVPVRDPLTYVGGRGGAGAGRAGRLRDPRAEGVARRSDGGAALRVEAPGIRLVVGHFRWDRSWLMAQWLMARYMGFSICHLPSALSQTERTTIRLEPLTEPRHNRSREALRRRRSAAARRPRAAVARRRA